MSAATSICPMVATSTRHGQTTSSLSIAVFGVAADERTVARVGSAIRPQAAAALR